MELLVGKAVAQGIGYFTDRKKAKQERRADEAERAIDAQNLSAAEAERAAALKKLEDVTRRRETEAANATATEARTRRRGGKRGVLTFTETGDTGVIGGLSSRLGG